MSSDGQTDTLSLDQIEVGMPRQEVLSGLAKGYSYNVQKVEGSDLDTLVVFDKGVHYPDPKAEIRAWIMFDSNGKVTAVKQFLAHGEGPEVIALAQELFRAAYPFAHSVDSQNGRLNTRKTIVTLEVEEIHLPQIGDSQAVKLNFGKSSVTMMVHTGSNSYASNVELTQDKP
jgi:hypothetical protein